MKAYQVLTNVNSEATHVLAVQFVPGVFGVALVIELDKGERALLAQNIQESGARGEGAKEEATHQSGQQRRE